MTLPPAEDVPPVAATRARHLVIRASAGSGKTFQLVIRYLRTLLTGVPAEQILASTFTRKAAGEILQRLLGRLAKAARDPAECEQLAEDLGDPGFNRNACLRVLKSLTGELHRLRIGTLDSFFGRLGKSYTLELGLPPGWDIIEELEDAALRRQAIAEILQDGTISDIHKLANLLSKGDAGRSVSRQIHETIDSHYGIFQQTNREAWHQFPELFPLNAEARDAAIEALQSVELPDLKSYRKARDADCQQAQAQDWEQFLGRGFPEKILRGLRTFGSSKQEISDETLAVYSQLIDHARAIIVRERSARTSATYELLAKFDAAYRRLKRESRRLRFEDVTLALEQAFDDEPVLPLMHRLDGDVSHLLLDEFQDTSRSQWAVLRPFAERITHESEGTSFFCVGDGKQAIYGWRGGVAEIFDAVQDELPDITSESLVKSWRSSQVVIDAVNDLFAGLPQHANLKDDEPAIQNWCAGFEAHQTAISAPGFVTVETPRESDGPEADKPVEKVLPAAVRLVQTIAEGAPDVEIAVLVRRNASIATVIHGLQALGIDASEEGGNPLTDSAGVQLLLSLVTLADHPGDTAARYHVATSPLGVEIGFTDFEDDRDAGRLAAKIRRQLNDDGYGPTVEQWTRWLIPHVSQRDRGRLGQLVELAYRYEAQATLRPSRFVNFVEATRVDAPSPAKVRVMSIHQAKGLEFDVVVLPLVEHTLVARPPKYVAGRPSPTARPNLVFDYPSQGIRPLLPEDFQQACRASRAAQVHEELCSLYVAVTRAAHALHIVVPSCEKSGDRLPKNSAGLVRATLCDGAAAPAGRVLYQRGDQNWATHRERSPSESSVDIKASDSETSAPLVVKLAEMADGRSRGLRRVAPSQAVSGERIRLEQLVRGTQSVAMKRGTLFHAWFEQIKWLDDEQPEETLLHTIAQQLGHSSAETQLALGEFREMIARPAVADLLSQEVYLSSASLPFSQAVQDQLAGGPLDVEVHRERPVVARVSGELMNGTIDRLVLLSTESVVVGADIIDFKTDKVGPGGAADLPRTAHYRRQLDAYVVAISRIYDLPSERIAARLAFVESGEIVTLPGV